MKISVIIPVYKTEKYIRRCLMSCLEGQGMTTGEYEVIVVDDCSPDSSMDIVNELASQYSQIRVVTMAHNVGLSAARNAGISIASGEYIFFLDSDDWMHSRVLCSMYEHASQNKLDMMPFGFVLSHEQGDEMYCAVYDNSRDIMSGQSYCLTQKIFMLVPWAALYRRKWMLENKLEFNGEIRYHEDEEFTPRAYFMAKRVSYFSKPCYEYRFKPSGTNSTSSKINLRAKGYLLAAESLYRFKQTYPMESTKARQYISSRIAYCAGMAVSLSDNAGIRRAVKNSDFYPLKDLPSGRTLKENIKTLVLNSSVELYHYLLNFF